MIRGGDFKTLGTNGFAKTSRPKALIPKVVRQNGSTEWPDLYTEWVDTKCGALQVMRGCSGRKLLWLVADLQAQLG
jgi:hypothetical protein